MQFLWNLISKIGLFVFFLILQAIAVYFIATRSDFHKNIIGAEFMSVNGFISNKTSKVSHFFNLPTENKSLQEENQRLKNEIAKYSSRIAVNDSVATKFDSVYRQKFTYVPARVVDYSLNKRDNYFLINKGKEEGLDEDMAVLSPNGIVGVILNSSKHYSSVVSVLHSKTNIKAKIKGHDGFGILKWNGEDYKTLSLTEIPKYTKVSVGDTIITAGASAVYPEGTLIGAISKFEPNVETAELEISITPFDDLSKVHSVYVVENLEKLDIQKAKEKENAITQ